MADQTTGNHERELTAIAARMGWEVVSIYKDEGISGSKGRDKRPVLDAMLKDVTRRKFDMVMAWSVDRLGQSLAPCGARGLSLSLRSSEQRLAATGPRACRGSRSTT